MHKANKVANSKLFVPGSESDELSYAFVEPLKEYENGSRAIFGVFQIKSTSDLYHTIIAQTVKNFTGYFNRASSSFSNQGSPVSTGEFIFENALQYTGNQLSHFLRDLQEQSGRPSSFDGKRVSMLLGMIWDNELYISTAGNNVKAFYVYPNPRQTGLSHYGMVDILEGNEEYAEGDPSALFSQVIAGSVAIPESTLIVCNQSFLDYVHQDQIKQAVTSYPNEKLSSYFQSLLGKANNHVDFSSLFLKMTQRSDFQSLGSIRAQPIPHTSMQDLVSTEKDTETIMSPAVGPHIKDAILQGLQTFVVHPFSKLKNLVSTKRIQGVTEMVGKLSPKGEQLSKGKEHLNKGKEQLSKGMATLQNKVGTHGASLFQQGKIKYYQLRKKEPAEIVDEAKLFIVTSSKKIWGKIMDRLQALPLVSKALLAVAVLFFFAFIASLFSIHGKQIEASKEKSYLAIVAAIEQSANSAEAALIYDDEDKAKLMAADAETKLATLPNISEDQKKNYARLKEQIEVTKRKISRIFIVSSTKTVATLDNQVPTLDSLKIMKAKDGYILYNADSIYTLDNAGKVLQVNTQAKLTAVSCGAESEVDTFYFCGNENKLFTLNPKEQTVSLTPITLEEKTSMNKLAVYNTRLYVLDSDHGSLTRHSKKKDGFGGGSDVVKSSEVKLGGAKGVVIDGSIIILGSDSQLTKVTSGKATQIPYPTMNPPLTSVTKIWTDSDSLYYYLLDTTENRIVVLDKRTNKLKAQLVSDKFTQLRDITVNEKNKEITVVNGSEIIKAPIDFLSNSK